MKFECCQMAYVVAMFAFNVSLKEGEIGGGHEHHKKK